jgi:predicted metal-dependent hydrolase
MTGPHFPYQVRESTRAKYMSLRVTVERGLEVVVPRGFNRRLIASFLTEKQSWVQSALAKVEEARGRRTSEAAEALPTEIVLPSIHGHWIVEYVPKAARRITLTDDKDGRLRVCGPTDNTAACRLVLQQWIHRQAYTALVPWLRRLSAETGIAFVQTAIRCQKSRWGSCSSSGTISLNQKLLFVEPDLVRYVLIHELCHMREMNHSRHYWKLVGQFYPEYRLARRRLKEAWFQMPRWAG